MDNTNWGVEMEVKPLPEKTGPPHGSSSAADAAAPIKCVGVLVIETLLVQP